MSKTIPLKRHKKSSNGKIKKIMVQIEVT